MRTQQRSPRTALLAATAAAVSLSACTTSPTSVSAPTPTTTNSTGPTSTTGSTGSTGPTSTVKGGSSTVGGAGSRFLRFEAFDSCKSLLAYLQEAGLKRVGPYGFNGNPYGGWVSPGAPVFATTATTAAAAASGPASIVADGAKASTSGDSSGTNTQEQGVDEGDTVENDGRYVYAVFNEHQVQIVDTASATKVATAELPPGQQQIILDGKRLVVVTGGWGDIQAKAFADVRWAGGIGATTVSIFDVGDPTKPTLTSQSTLEGNALAVRASDGTVRIVVTSGFGERLPLLQPARAGKDAEEKAKKLNEEVIKDSKIEDWLPRSADGKPGAMGKPGQAVDCNQIGKPGEFAGLGLTWVASVDLKSDSPKVLGSGGVVAEGSIVYSSEKSLYIATTRWQEPSPDPDVQPINPDPPKTAIHQFAFDGNKSIYKSSGVVDGVLLNSYAMSEYNGNLRIATTDQAANFGRAQSSGVHVLAPKGDVLEEVGSVKGLGAGEQIQAVRFLGELGYVVTFRQTDPLFVIDLKDPTNPKMVGELKIPGFSSYLHPIKDGLLLGVGQGGQETGQLTGSQLALFDVKDPTKPTRLATLSLGQGFTEAQYDPHAFLYWDQTGQVVVPTQNYGQAGQRTGATVAKVSDTAITLQGKIPGLLQPGAPEIGPAQDCPENANGCYLPDYAVPFSRSMVVNGKLVLVGYSGIKIVALDTLDPIGTVSFDVR